MPRRSDRDSSSAKTAQSAGSSSNESLTTFLCRHSPFHRRPAPVLRLKGGKDGKKLGVKTKSSGSTQKRDRGAGRAKTRKVASKEELETLGGRDDKVKSPEKPSAPEVDPSDGETGQNEEMVRKENVETVKDKEPKECAEKSSSSSYGATDEGVEPKFAKWLGPCRYGYLYKNVPAGIPSVVFGKRCYPNLSIFGFIIFDLSLNIILAITAFATNFSTAQHLAIRGQVAHTSTFLEKPGGTYAVIIIVMIHDVIIFLAAGRLMHHLLLYNGVALRLLLLGYLAVAIPMLDPRTANVHVTAGFNMVSSACMVFLVSWSVWA